MKYKFVIKSQSDVDNLEKFVKLLNKQGEKMVFKPDDYAIIEPYYEWKKERETRKEKMTVTLPDEVLNGKDHETRCLFEYAESDAIFLDDLRNGGYYCFVSVFHDLRYRREPLTFPYVLVCDFYEGVNHILTLTAEDINQLYKGIQ
jgi:hypothetical protein